MENLANLWLVVEKRKEGNPRNYDNCNTLAICGLNRSRVIHVQVGMQQSHRLNKVITLFQYICNNNSFKSGFWLSTVRWIIFVCLVGYFVFLATRCSMHGLETITFIIHADSVDKYVEYYTIDISKQREEERNGKYG